MFQNEKSENGITLVSLVITLIVIAILTGIGFTIGNASMIKAKDNKRKIELDIVQHAVLEQYEKFKLTEDTTKLIGFKMNLEEVKSIASQIGVTLVSIPSTLNNADYYRLDKASLKEIGIINADDEYIINYQTGEVINKTILKTSDGKALYTKSTSLSNE